MLSQSAHSEQLHKWGVRAESTEAWLERAVQLALKINR
jgi:hypothetical protein